MSADGWFLVLYAYHKVMSSLLAVGACPCHKVALSVDAFVDLLESMRWRCTFQACVWWDIYHFWGDKFPWFQVAFVIVVSLPLVFISKVSVPVLVSGIETSSSS